jgi:hypothetical protein
MEILYIFDLLVIIIRAITSQEFEDIILYKKYKKTYIQEIFILQLYAMMGHHRSDRTHC